MAICVSSVTSAGSPVSRAGPCSPKRRRICYMVWNKVGAPRESPYASPNIAPLAFFMAGILPQPAPR
jgi:hypothetical protein